MTGLVLKLAPNERILINGAVIENGNRRSRLNIVTPGANILRLRDAIHPDKATTPVGRLCYVAQLVLSGDADPGRAHAELRDGIDRIAAAMLDPDSRAALFDARLAIDQEQTYFALKALRRLLPREAAMLQGVAT